MPILVIAHNTVHNLLHDRIICVKAILQPIALNLGFTNLTKLFAEKLSQLRRANTYLFCQTLLFYFSYEWLKRQA